MEEKPKSVFMVAHSDAGKYSALYEVKIQPDGEVTGVAGQPLEPVVKLFDNKGTVVPKHSNLAAARFFSRSKLYLWLNNSNSNVRNEQKATTNTTSAPSYGYVLDTKTKSLVPFKPPQAHKPSATVISAFGNLYLLANPECWPEIPTPAFERYDPATDCWESLPPFPGYNHCKGFKITAYAVCYSFILITTMRRKDNYLDFNVTRKQWAFDVTRKQWHEVKVPATQYSFTDDMSVARGRAVVVDDTIYTFNSSCTSVVAFNFWWDLDEDGDVTFYVSTESILKGLETRSGTEGKKEGYLVHLGNLDFCLVQKFERAGYQGLCITMFQVVVEGGERHIQTLHSTICNVDSNFLRLSYCFSPDVEDIEPKEEERVMMSSVKSMQREEETVVSTNGTNLSGTSIIPGELMYDILARLSTKDLIGLMCVSKAWSAAIQDPQLARLHLQHSIKNIHSLNPRFYILPSQLPINYFYPVALFNNDDTNGKVLNIKYRSDRGRVQNRNRIIGCCHGLLCICRVRYSKTADDHEYEDFCLWNPAAQKFKKIPLSSFSKFTQKKTSYGFGYDSVNHDYKFVRLAQFDDQQKGAVKSSEVQVYSLNSHSWKRIQDLPAHLNRYFEVTSSEGVCVDGAVHWLMRVRGHERRKRMMVLTLHLTTEEYHWFEAPNYKDSCCCANSRDERDNKHRAFLQALGGCLCFRLQCDFRDVWILEENGVAESWTKLFYSTKEVHLYDHPLMLSECGNMVLFSTPDGIIFWIDSETRSRCEVLMMTSPDCNKVTFDVLSTCQTLHLLRRRPELPWNNCC